MTTVRPGDRVKDIVTGATGIAICRSEWQYGCVRITIQPEVTKDSKPVEPFVVDEPQLEIVKAQAVPDTREPETCPPLSGDRPMATRAAEPHR